jgi:epoxyqueuosine reductase
VASLLQRIKEQAAAQGFDAVRIAPAEDLPEAASRLQEFIEQDRHGTMEWMAQTLERRSSPRSMWPEARSAILFAQNYGPAIDPMERLEDKSTGVISVYALNRDYHDVVKGKLKRIAQWLSHETKNEVKVFVDTAPLMEKPLAQRAGLGWQGRHTNLVSRELGSWFFIGTILTTAALEPDTPEPDHCGSCRACLDICPTDAFPAPYQIDARRCISYLTIEHKGHIAREFRKAIGNRIYGCDDCLAICPWNKFAKAASDAKLQARDDLIAPSLHDLLRLDDAGFRKLFSGSPVKRIGRDRFVRNVLIAAGNSNDATLLPLLETLLDDASPLVRAMAVWALSQITDSARIGQLRALKAGDENDPNVLAEWATA